jgi:hypothetical protein
MLDNIPQGVFDREQYWEAQLENAQRSVEVARRNLAAIALDKSVGIVNIPVDNLQNTP